MKPGVAHPYHTDNYKENMNQEPQTIAPDMLDSFESTSKIACIKRKLTMPVPDMNTIHPSFYNIGSLLLYQLRYQYV